MPAIVAGVQERWRIPTAIVRTAPEAHDEWLADTAEAVERLLR